MFSIMRPSLIHSLLMRAALCGALVLPLVVDAAALGDATVRSSIGQPLDAEIEIASLSGAEAESLAVRLAPADAFASAGIDSTALLRSLRFAIEKKGDRQLVRVSSDLAVNDPFVNLLVELSANGSRTIRQYALLIDPPAIDAPPEPNLSAITPAITPAQTPPATTATTSALTPERRVVRKGDTLRSIAGALQPDGVQLEQVMVALQNANPSAFIGRNANRIRSGSVLTVPDAATIGAVDPAAARLTLRAQTADFIRYQKRLAERSANLAAAASTAPAEAGNRSSSGDISVQLKDANAAPAAGDKLTLSSPGNGDVTGAGANPKEALDKLAADKALADANSRIETLEKNIGQMQSLLETQNQRLADAQQRAAPPLPQQKPQAAPQEPASLPNDFAARGMAGGAVVLLLLAWLWRRSRRARTEEAVAPEAEPTVAQTVIGESGGRQVDTNHSVFHSNFVPSVSQIDANEVDAVAEADVYIAYGRDEQAEEILLDALRAHPQRHALRVKLLEIYATRKDKQKFGTLAAELRVFTHGQGPDWAQAAQLGQMLEPGNHLYGVPSPATLAPEPDSASPVADFELKLEGLLDERRKEQEAAPSTPDSEPSNTIDFQLSGIAAGAGSDIGTAALNTKLELALACREIGDNEGARELLAEVARARDPALALRAKVLLQQLA